MSIADATERMCDDFIAEVDELNAYGAVDALDLEAQDAVTNILVKMPDAGGRSPRGAARKARRVRSDLRGGGDSGSAGAPSGGAARGAGGHKSAVARSNELALLHDDRSWARMTALFELLFDEVGDVDCALRVAATLRDCAQSAVRSQESGLQLDAVGSAASETRMRQLEDSGRRLAAAFVLEARAHGRAGRQDASMKAGRRAVLLYQRLLAQRRTEGGRGPRSVGIDAASAFSALGKVELESGAEVKGFASAIPLFEEAVRLSVEVEGERSPRAVAAMDDLASAFSARGDLASAKGVALRALAARRAALGSSHVEVGKTLNVLGILCQQLDDFAESRERFDEALEVMREVAGERHVSTAYVLNNMGTMEFYRRNYEEAAQLHLLAAGILAEYPAEQRSVSIARKNGNKALKLSVQAMPTATKAPPAPLAAGGYGRGGKSP